MAKRSKFKLNSRLVEQMTKFPEFKIRTLRVIIEPGLEANDWEVDFGFIVFQ
jgi:hypothetical protein